MPELPEVETIRRGLEKRTGERVASVEVRQPKILEACAVADLEQLAGSTLVAVDRKAKYLLLRFDAPQRTLVVHLGMTGQLTWKADGQAHTEGFRRLVTGYQKALGPHSIDLHTHLVMHWESGSMLLFRDPRRFGKILWFAGWDDGDCARLLRLGPDAWRLEVAMMVSRLRQKAGRRGVKAVLLDQSVVAGIGNIYADEACFAAGIRPTRSLASLGAARLAALARAIDTVLEKGVVHSGTSFSDYVDAEGAKGSNQESLRVYGRVGQDCLECGRTLVGAVVAQRSTVWCPKCQT